MSQDAINASAQNAVVAINSLNKFIDLISTTLVTSTATLADIDAKQFGTTNTTAYTTVGQKSAYIGSGTVVRISVISAGTTQGYVYDKASTGAVSSESLSAIPNTIGIYDLHIRFSLGIVVEPGTGQVVLISYTPD